MSDNRRLTRLRQMALLAAALALAGGCRPPVGVRVVLPGEQTRLERRVLGSREVVKPQRALLPLRAPASARHERETVGNLRETYLQQLADLRKTVEPTPQDRLWEAIILHNAAVLSAALGERQRAESLLQQASALCEAYVLPTVHWQVLLTLAELRGGQRAYASLRHAAEVLENAVPLSATEREVWSERAANELYSRLVAIAMAENDPEAALAHAESRRAVELAFALEPGALSLPEGEMKNLLQRLDAATRRLAETRRQTCSTPVESLGLAGGKPKAKRELAVAWEAVQNLRSAIRDGSPVGGLIVPAPADPYAAQELLAPDTALLMVEPLDGDRFAVFLLGAEAFQAESVHLPPALVARASADSVLAASSPQSALSELSGSVLGPFERQLGDGVKRLYLAPPARLSAVAWQALPFHGQALGKRFQVCFVGSLADLTASFSRKSYGRRSLLVCRGWPGEPAEPAAAVEQLEHASSFDLAHAGKSDFAARAGFYDFLFFSNPLLVRARDPSQSYLAFPGPLGILSGLGINDLCGLDTSASCAGFRELKGNPWRQDSYVSLRVFTRALAAAGISTAIYSAGGAPESAAARFWRKCFDLLKGQSSGEAFRLAVSELEPRYRPRFRLYGFIGMNREEYVQFSRLEFSDLFRSAVSHMRQGQLRQAASVLLDLGDMAKVLEFPQPQKRALVLANLQQYLVQCWTGLREYDLAVQHQQRRIEYLKAHPGLPEAALAGEYQSLGALLTKAERFQQATDSYQKALELLLERGQEEKVATLLAELGKSQDRAAHYETALESFRQALEKYRSLHNQEGIGRQLQRIGAIHLRRLSDPHRAEQHFRDALRAFEAAGKPSEALSARIDIGLCRRRVGDFEGALKLLTLSLEASRSSGQRALEARALTEIANTRWFEGSYQAALEAVHESNEIAQKLDLPFQLNVNYQLLGLIYWELNQYERAHRALEEAARYARRAEQPLEIASAFNNRGIVYRRQKEYEHAISSFHRALDIDSRLSSRWGQAYDHRNIGITRHRMGQFQQAAAHLEKAVTLSTEIDDVVNLTRALFSLGDLRLDMNRFDEAETLLRRSLENARRIHLPEVEWRALRALGRLYRQRGENQKALEMFKDGVGVVEQMRGSIRIEQFRSGFLSNKMDLYEDTVSLLLELGRSAQAFTYAERSRARRFIDVLDGQSISLKSERDKELYENQRALKAQMSAVATTLGREDNAEKRQQLAEELNELRSQYTRLLLSIKAANPQLAGFVTVEAVEPGQLYDLPGQDTALLVYYLMEKQIAIWVIRDRALHLYTAHMDRKALSRKVKEFRLMIQNRELLANVKRRAQDLYRELIEPVEPYIRGAKVVGIVPHRALHYLSFASLYDGEAYLVESVPLFYSPSASLLPPLLKSTPEGDKRNLAVLAVANPAVGRRAYELPFTEKEALSIGRDFNRVRKMLGKGATESNVIETAPGSDIIHIGAHGRFDEVNPLLSSLVLAPDEREDGNLELHEVTGLKLNARLVTLSACQSGLGTLKAADELVSLSRAFMYAGTNAILSTLWRVDDVSTALLSKHFYRHYVEHGKAESLRYAQLQVMNDGRHYHPAYWAAMVLTGDYR